MWSAMLSASGKCQWQVPRRGCQEALKNHTKKVSQKRREAKQGHCEEVEGRLRPGVGEALGDPNF